MWNLARLVGTVALSLGLSYLPVQSSVQNYLSPKKLDMAYIPPTTVIKKKGENLDHLNDSSLEDIIRQKGGSSEDAKNVIEGKYALQKVEELDNEFIQSGKYGKLASWCYDKGYKVPEKSKLYGASKENEDAVAWTNPDAELLGTHTYFDDKVQQMAEDTGLNTDQIIELCITHEYMHKSQNLSEFGNNVYMIEGDNEINLAKYFYDTAMKVSDEENSERYIEMTNVCLGRYLGIMAAYLHEQGIEVELNEETVGNLLKDFADYVKNNPPEDLEQENLEGKVEGDFEGGTEDVDGTGSGSGNGVDVEASEYVSEPA